MTIHDKQTETAKNKQYYKQTNYKIFRIFFKRCLEQPQVTKLEDQNLIAYIINIST